MSADQLGELDTNGMVVIIQQFLNYLKHLLNHTGSELGKMWAFFRHGFEVSVSIEFSDVICEPFSVTNCLFTKEIQYKKRDGVLRTL